MNYFTSIKNNALFVDIVLLLARVFLGFAMISHGYPKLQKLMDGGEIEFFDFLGFGPHFTLILVVFAEFVCSIFLILGLFTRWAAFFLFFTMAIAAFVVHGADAFDKREMALLYLSVYLLFLVLGPGRFSIDGMISKRERRSRW